MIQHQNRYVYIASLLVALSSISGLVAIIKYIDPFHTTVLIISLFYITLLLSLWSIFFLVNLLVRQKIIKKQLFESSIKVSFRQSILISILISGCVLLSSLHLFNWWSALTTVLLVVMIELFLSAN